MIIEIAAIVSIAALMSVAMLGHVLAFRAMFAHADRASGQLPDNFSPVTA
jgi:hypothetical protein